MGTYAGEETFVAATGSAAIAETLAPKLKFRLIRVELHLDSAPASTAENFTVTLDAERGAAYDVLLFSQDLYTDAVQDLVVEFGKGYEFEANDEIDIAWTNTPTETYGMRIVYELI